MTPRQPKACKTIEDLPDALPLFVLPGGLVFAREILPLNIFEPQYLGLVNHALATERTIGLIQPLEKEAAAKHPALQSVGCAARLVSFQETSDDRYLITVRGACRFSVKGELDPGEDGFRMAAVDYAPFELDLKPSQDVGRINRTGLIDVVRKYLEANDMDANWDVIHQTPDESLVNYLCMVSPFGVSERQALLEAQTLIDRTDMIIALAERLMAQSQQGSTPMH